MIKVALVYTVMTGCHYFKKSCAQLERTKKSLQKTLKDFDLEIVAESKLRIIN